MRTKKIWACVQGDEYFFTAEPPTYKISSSYSDYVSGGEGDDQYHCYLIDAETIIKIIEAQS